MVILLSAPDRCGKTTQINNIKNYLEEKGKLVHYLHYSAIKGEDIKNRSKQYYSEMFQLIKFATHNNINLILDRCHDGECVYGPIYRGYSGDFVFDIELNFGNRVLNNCLLITFIDKPENLVKREDGLSFTVELDKKQREVNLFKDFYEKSNIKHKLLIDIDGKSIETVFEPIRTCLDNDGSPLYL